MGRTMRKAKPRRGAVLDLLHQRAAAEDGRPWKDDPENAEAVFIAAIAGLPATPPATTHDDAGTALRPAERGRLLAMQLLERSGLKLPAG